MYIDKFDKWYDSLSPKQQAEVDDLADDLGYNLYEDCADYELAHLMEMYWGNPAKSVKASYDPTEADTYIVRIWYEIDPDHDVAMPQAAQEIIEVVANSPQQAKEYALKEWDGPVDRIEIVDINPDYSDELFPFEASTSVTASTNPEDDMRAELFKEYSDPDTMEYRALLDIDWTDVTAEDSALIVSQGLPKKPAQVSSISYWNHPEDGNEGGYDFAGGYVFEYKNGTVLIWGYEDGDPSLQLYMQGNTEDLIRACDDAEARPITASETIMSQLSFDFIHDGSYAESDIEAAVYDALAASGCIFEASSFESVDYSDSPEFRDYAISQMSVDFTWDKYEGYDSQTIMQEIESRMYDLGYEVIGYDFRSLD